MCVLLNVASLSSSHERRVLVTAQLMRFHCRIPQHYLVLLSLSGCVVFAASTSCLLDAAGLAVRCVGCALRESRRFLRQRFFIDRCDLCAPSIVARSRFAVVLDACYALDKTESCSLKVVFFAREPSGTASHACRRLPVEPAASCGRTSCGAAMLTLPLLLHASLPTRSLVAH